MYIIWLQKNYESTTTKTAKIYYIVTPSTFLQLISQSELDNRGQYFQTGIGTALRGWALCKVMPNLSSMFKSSGLTPSSSFQSKAWIIEPNIKGNIRIANSKPGHILLSPPNGRFETSNYWVWQQYPSTAICIRWCL